MESNVSAIALIENSDNPIKQKLALFKNDIKYLLPTTAKKPDNIIIRQTLNKRIAEIEKLINE